MSKNMKSSSNSFYFTDNYYHGTYTPPPVIYPQVRQTIDSSLVEELEKKIPLPFDELDKVHFDNEGYEEDFKIEIEKIKGKPKTSDDHNLVIASGGKLSTYSKKEFESLGSDTRRKLLAFGTIFDTKTMSRVDYTSSGIPSSKRNFTYDDEILVHDFLERVKVEKDKNTPKKERVYLSFEDVISILKTPVMYFEKISKKSSSIDKLLSYTIQEPDMFDEIFTLKVRGPESPLLRTYLDNLALLVDQELSKSDEIENMDALQKEAYEKVGYVDKILDTVINEAKDFQDYFRFLLNKKDKVVISEKENDYVKVVAKVAERNYGNKLKKQGGNKELKLEDDIISKQFYFKERIDKISSTPGQIICTLFIYVHDIMNIFKYLEEKHIDLRVAFINKIMKHNYAEKALQFELFISDANYNCNLFTIKASTLIKYNKRLDELLKDFDAHYNEIKETYLRKELLSLNSI